MSEADRSFDKVAGRTRIRTLTCTALLSAVASVLFFLSVPIPLFPSFVKMDLSNVPALIASFAIGPAAGAMVELIKNLTNVPSTTTGGVGELAAFLIGVALVLPAGIMFKRRGMAISLVFGSAVSVAAAAAANYFILIPLYSNFIPIDKMIQMYSAAIPAADSLERVILFSVVPFNIIKCAIVSSLAYLITRKMLKGASQR